MRTARIGRPEGPVAPDRAPDRIAAGTTEPLRSQLVDLVGAEQVLARPLDLVRYASDASPYRRFPAAVVLARHEADVAALLGHAQRTGTALTFRGGGTSLNGQAQTEGILVDVRRHWSGVRVEAGGNGGVRARVRAGTLLGHANRILARHGHRLGPDPASTNIATVGGVIANNSGGMRCGTTWDSYSTVESMTLVLASGTVIDTAAPDAEERFAAAEPALARGLRELRDELRADSELCERVRRKFAIKNTMGYRLCAFLDADTPLEIFRRLVVGSEGTLAFVAEAVFRARPEPARTTVAWLYFESIDAAVAPVGELVAAGARATELMVAPALMVAAWNIAGTPEHWKELPPDSAALLVEFGGEDDAALDRAEAGARRILDGHAMLRPVEFEREREAIELNWSVREGMFGLVGRLRPPGTALIIEDVCVEPARIAEACTDLQALLGEHGFLTGVAGHVSAGNVHFQLTPDFSVPEDRERYEAFLDRMTDLVVSKYDGSLKAEHGTGRNMAPFLEREWGAKATAMMWRIKELADPAGVLNPGAILDRDPEVHLRDLKVLVANIEEEAAGCVECGFCEPVCPSRNTTTTPRQRIVLRRELARQAEGAPVYEAILRDYGHDAIDTCAADGTCAPACPLAIDTGKVMKEFRARIHTPRQEAAAVRAAERYATAEATARAGLRAAPVARAAARAADALSRAARSRFSSPGNHNLDLGGPLAGLARSADALPPPAPPLPTTPREGAAAVYLPACINRILGHAERPSLPATLVEVSARAGLPLWIPSDVAGHCCSAPWSSKGYRAGHDAMARRTLDALWRWTEGGALPVVTDATSCALGLVQDVGAHLGDERFDALEVLDSIAWAHDRLLPALDVTRRVGTVALHPTCSSGHLGLAGKLEALLGALAEEVLVPAGTTCCGMAGDRGLIHPELPESALRDAAADLEGRDLDACVCANRTCELGLSAVTGRDYASFVYLLEAATRAPSPG